jgi:hypothetical protein
VKTRVGGVSGQLALVQQEAEVVDKKTKKVS